MSSGYRLSIWCGTEEIQGNLTNKIDIDFSPYRAVNTLRLGYKNQSVNVVQGNNRCLFSDPHKYTEWAEGKTAEC